MLKDLALFVLLFTAFSSSLYALDIPKRPSTYVTDQAGLLSPDARARLEQVLSAYERQTTNQVVVLTLPSLEGEALEDFSIRLAEAWKVGQQDRDNGVIFLIAQAEREIRIEVGYGLEGVLPDALAGQIIYQEVAPYFRAGKFEEGISRGVLAILRATQGEYQSRIVGDLRQGELTPQELEALQAQGKAVGIFVLAVIAILFVIDFFRYQRYLYDRRLYLDRYGFWEWWFRFALLLFLLSFIFRILFYTLLFSRGGYYGSRSGFGGFSGGGGSFGGGGASGRW